MEVVLNQTDIVNIIIQTINTIFSNLFSTIDNSVYNELDNYVFIDSSIIENTFFEKMLGANGKNGLIFLADAMIVGIALFYIVRYFYLNLIDTTVEKPSKFIFKLFIFALLINFSYFIFDQILNINSLISTGIRDIGSNIVNKNISFSELISELNKSIISSSAELNVFSLDGIIKSFVSIGLVNLLLSYSLRYIIIQVLILFSPFAILSLMNYSTSWIFKAWGKCIFSLLIIQVFIPLIIIVIFCIDKNNKILYVGGVYALAKINDYIREMFGGLAINISNNFNGMMSNFRK